MTYFPDLDLCRYHGGPNDPRNWAVPLLAIGWLEHPQPYQRGAVDSGFTRKLDTLLARMRPRYAQYYFRGHHACSLCTSQGREPPQMPFSQKTLFIPGEQVVYLAPGGIVHYIEAHSYRPPEAFVTGVLRCPIYGSPPYRLALKAANAGVAAPMETFQEHIRQNHERFRIVPTPEDVRRVRKQIRDIRR